MLEIFGLMASGKLYLKFSQEKEHRNHQPKYLSGLFDKTMALRLN